MSDAKHSKSGHSGEKVHFSSAVAGFLLPNILGFLAFTLFPVILSFIMAFTNWSLKPGLELEWIALRNFSDLLGMNPLHEHSNGLLAVIYCAAAVILLAALVLFLWARLTEWHGIRQAGSLVTGVGLAVIVMTVAAHADHGYVLGGLILVLLGLSGTMHGEQDWKAGKAWFPALLILASSAILWLLHESMWASYEPRDIRFWKYFYNTVYLMLGIPLNIAGSLGLALLLNEDLPIGAARQRVISIGLCTVSGIVTFFLLWSLGMANIGLLGLIAWIVAGMGLAFNVVSYRTLYYLPTFTSGVAVMILWKALYNPQTGPINVGISMLFPVDIESLPKWLSSYLWSKPALMLMGFWIGVGGTNMLLYLAALSNLPKDLMDAAEVDGANRWQRLRHIILPQLAPTTFFISIMSVIGGIQGGFEQARVMTGGGPDGATTTLSYYIYNIAFQDLDLGYAAAVSWIMFGIIAIATMVNWRFGKELEVN